MAAAVADPGGWKAEDDDSATLGCWTTFRAAGDAPGRRSTAMPGRAARWRGVATLVLGAGLGVVALHNLLAWARFALHRAFEGDFGLYYAFARIGLHQGFHNLYDLAAQRREWDAVGPLLWYPAPYPPFLAWLVAPFALLPFPLAYAAWNALLAAALVGTWWLLAPGSRSLRGL